MVLDVLDFPFANQTSIPSPYNSYAQTMECGPRDPKPEMSQERVRLSAFDGEQLNVLWVWLFWAKKKKDVARGQSSLNGFTGGHTEFSASMLGQAGGGFDLSRAGPLRRIQNRARSAPVPKNGLPKRTKKAGSDQISSHLLRYQAWIWWSTTFLHDRWDRSRASRKKKVVRLSVSESSCGRSGFSEVVFLRSFFGLELRMRMLKRHEGCHFLSGVGAWPMGAWTPYGDCARQVNALSRRFPLRRNDQSLREVEQMRQTEVETNYDSGKQTWRSSLAIDEQQWWDLGLNSMWWLRWTSQRIVAAFLFVGETTVAKLERSWESCAKPKWKQTTRQSKTWRRKPCFWQTKSSTYGLIADQISAPVLSAPTDLLREQIRWSTAPTVLGQTEPAEPPNRTPDPAAPSDLLLLLGTNRMRPGVYVWG